MSKKSKPAIQVGTPSRLLKTLWEKRSLGDFGAAFGVEDLYYGYLEEASLPYACILVRRGIAHCSILKDGLPIFLKSCSNVDIAKFLAETLCPF